MEVRHSVTGDERRSSVLAGGAEMPGRPGESAARIRRVLAVVVTFGDQGVELTDAAVASLTAQDPAAALEILVVDNGSSPAVVAELERMLRDRARLAAIGVNRGYAAACNRGLADGLRTGADAVWLLNNDVSLEAGALDRLVGALEGDEDAAAAAPATTDMPSGSQVLGAGADLSLWRGRIRHRHAGEPASSLPAEPYAVDVLEGAALLVRTRAVREIGPIDEGFFMYWEDTEWSHRARSLGWRLLVVPGARVRHHQSMSTEPRPRIELMIRNRIRFVRASGGRLRQVAFVVYLVGAWLPAYVAFRLVPRFGIRAAFDVAAGALAWNVRDARARGRWRLRRADLELPALPGVARP